jgi:small-conductance mechanosensitive channel
MILEGMKENQTSFKILNTRTIPIYHLLAKSFIVITAIYLLLLAWGINVMLWITSAGIIGVAIAYASQDTLASLFAGIAILSDSPYRLGNFLVLENGTKGKVIHIGFRSTRMLTVENIEIIIPNSILASAQIINMSGGDSQHARIDILAGVAYGSDIDQVKELLLEIANELNYVVHDEEKMKPTVHFITMGASSLDFVLRIWISNPEEILNIQDQANTLIYKRFSKENIEIPYAKQDVYLYPMGDLSIKK